MVAARAPRRRVIQRASVNMQGWPKNPSTTLRRLHSFVVVLHRSRSFFASPQRQGFTTKREHTERWPTLIVNVLRNLGFGCRFLRSSSGRACSPCQDRLVGHSFVCVPGDLCRHERPVRIWIGCQGQSYPAIVQLAADHEAYAEIMVLGIPAPISTGISAASSGFSCLDEAGEMAENVFW